MSAKKGARILGPYHQRNGHLIIEIDDDGNRTSSTFPTTEKAERYKAILEAELEKQDSPVSRVGALPSERGMVRRIDRSSGVRWQVYGRRNGKQVYVGTYDTEEEAALARRTFSLQSQDIFGPPVRFRVVGVYGNGAERDLTAFDVAREGDTYDRGIGFVTQDEEFCVFVARRPLDDTPNDPLDVWQFNPETDIPSPGAPF